MPSTKVNLGMSAGLATLIAAGGIYLADLPYIVIINASCPVEQVEETNCIENGIEFETEEAYETFKSRMFGNESLNINEWITLMNIFKKEAAMAGFSPNLYQLGLMKPDPREFFEIRINGKSLHLETRLRGLNRQPPIASIPYQE